MCRCVPAAAESRTKQDKAGGARQKRRADRRSNSRSDKAETAAERERKQAQAIRHGMIRIRNRYDMIGASTYIYMPDFICIFSICFSYDDARVSVFFVFFFGKETNGEMYFTDAIKAF